MSERNPVLSIVKSRGRFAIHAGKSKLSKGFETEELAQANLDANADFYSYWAGSISVSVENSTPTIVRV